MNRGQSGGRDYLEREVSDRACHRTPEQARTTCSFARAERLLGREYHGRFLIELLQNAADAWRNDPRSSGGARSRVAVLIAEGPALLVANQGAPMTAEVVIESLGHIGASTKSEGEAIGHKGIGFKAVLEIAGAPEIYSGLQETTPMLAVRFDPEVAYSKIKLASSDWPALVSGIQGVDMGDPFAAVPVLRYPHWVDEVPAAVKDLAADGFDTVIRLPFDDRFTSRLKLNEDQWLATVRDALEDVSDQILLLLGCFSEAQIADALKGHHETVTPSWKAGPEPYGTGYTSQAVEIFRDGRRSSLWHLFRRTLPELAHLAGEIAVGIRLDGPSNRAIVLPAVDAKASALFHLFFPTRIASGLPFLLHGYFEVDAARTGFYRGSASRNRAILAELAALTTDAVRDVAQAGNTDLVTLVDLIAAAGEPEEEFAREFRIDVLNRLDTIAWVPTQPRASRASCARPEELFISRPDLTRQIARVFPVAYIEANVGLSLPDVRLSNAAFELVRSRQPRNGPDQWAILGRLCRPGETTIWVGDDADDGFHQLLNLLAALEVEDSVSATLLVDGLRGDPASRLLPTVGPEGGRVLLPVPDPSEGVSGRRSQLVMARARATTGEMLVPPDALDLAFLPAGLLASEAAIDRAKPLGVRPFTVDTVLDRLNGITDSAAEIDRETLLRFLWQLLSRERASGFGTKQSAERASAFDPTAWFWCRPGRAREDENTRLRQQRERYLAAVPVPCRDGKWSPAGTVAFGRDWADWLESGAAGNPKSAALIQRAAAYRALESISPGPHAQIAPPQELLPYLAALPHDVPGSQGDEDDEEVVDDRHQNAERLAFLLRLGVWEVPPIEAFESRDPGNRTNFPWVGPIADHQQSIIANGGGWTFGLDGWSGARHRNVYLAEDYRFAWPLGEMAHRSRSMLTTALQFGASLYAQRLFATVFCQKCNDSGGSHSATRYSSTINGYPSSLAVQLRFDEWATCTLDGKEVDRPRSPTTLWWHPKPPSGAGLRQSAYRLLPLCGPSTGMSDELGRLAGVKRLDDANLDVLRSLLIDLKSRFEQRALPVDPAVSGTARQAFVGLHRLVYERLAEIAVEQVERVTALLNETLILCELGAGLVYRKLEDARHDDGQFATYVRNFVGEIPFVTLPREREVTAHRLGIQPFLVELTRRGDDPGQDVTDEIRNILGDRIPELLSIVVHHSLGTQTLELTSLQFDERARRLQALTVRQLDDVVIDASIPGHRLHVTIGEGAGQELFLENPTSAAPVLYHDLSGEGWQDRLRRKIAPHIATIVENPAYSATFALFLQAVSDAEREEFLLELGISGEEVDAISTRIGIVDEEERQRHLRWFTAIARSRGTDLPELDLDPLRLVERLVTAGIPEDVAALLVEAGGGQSVRSDASEHSPLRLLADAGINLAALDTQLRALGDPGLSISIAKQRLAQWLELNRQRCAVVFAAHQPPYIAKESVRTFERPDSLKFAINPKLSEVIEPVVSLLRTVGVEVAAEALADKPGEALAKMGGYESVEALDAQVRVLYNEEEQERLLRERAAQWRRGLRLLAIVARSGLAETRATIRAIEEHVSRLLPLNPARPSDIVDALPALFADHPILVEALAQRLNDVLSAPIADRSELLQLAAKQGLDLAPLAIVERALNAPRRDQAKELKRRSERLRRGGVALLIPAGLQRLPTKSKTSTVGKKTVAAVKVGESQDQRKRELGDEGEQWALAAVVDQFLTLNTVDRDRAIDQVIALLRGVGLFEGFEGTPVEIVLSHAELARSPDADDEELIDELAGLLHVSRHSDAFGFDLIGWLPSSEVAAPKAICLEVKSSSSAAFNLSSGEWALAQRLHDAGEGDRYAVLVVRRGGHGGIPTCMDLLVDPVALVENGQLRQEIDGFKIAYQNGDLRSQLSAETR